MSEQRKFCYPSTKRYELTASEKNDTEIEDHLFNFYATLNAARRKQPMYRKWRRCVIVEALKRGIIDKDPGLGPPERR